MHVKPQPRQDEIALRAFQLWTLEGHPMDSAERHWLQAEAELRNGPSAKTRSPVRRHAKRSIAAP